MRAPSASRRRVRRDRTPADRVVHRRGRLRGGPAGGGGPDHRPGRLPVRRRRPRERPRVRAPARRARHHRRGSPRRAGRADPRAQPTDRASWSSRARSSHDVVDRASEAFTALIDGAARRGRRRRRPLRQGRRQRPDLERRAEARRCTPPRCSPTTTPTTRSRWSARPGSARATRSPRRSTSSIPVAPPQVPHRDYHLGFVDLGPAARPTRRTCPPARPGADAAGRRRALRHAAGERPDDAAAVLADVRRRVRRVLPPGVHRRSSPTTTCRCRCARATRCSSTPRCIHGAGTNTSTDIRRMANLLQISSPFGRAMESLDRTAMVRAALPGAARR